jgi:hypothetical protein
MHIEFIRDKEKKMPIIERPLTITSLKIWYCKFESLEYLKQFINLKSLEIAGYTGDNLNFLKSLTKLNKLYILHLPKVYDLGPLQLLVNLEELNLSVLPGWDASNKTTKVKSLAPISKLKKLKTLELIGILPESKSLKDLYSLVSLKKIRITKYPAKEIDDFSEYLKIKIE